MPFFLDFFGNKNLMIFDYGQSCVLCGDYSVSKLMICKACEADLPHNINFCKVCALQLKFGQNCPDCERLHPSFERVFTPFSYIFPIDELIKQFKDRQKWHYGKFLSLYLANFLQNEFSQTNLVPDVLVPIASSKKSMFERGFNQTVIMAKIVGKQLKIPIIINALSSSKQTVQKSLTADERRQNLAQFFILQRNLNWQNLHIAILDDVVTTGFTVNSAAKLFKDAGAKRVDVYCLARTSFK